MKQTLLFLFCCLWIQNTWGKGRAPVAFVENKHQWETPVKYRVDLPGGAAFLLKDGFTFNYLKEEEVKQSNAEPVDTTRGTSIKETILVGHAYNVSFAGCNANVVIRGEEKQTAYYNYFIGKDSTKWAGNVPLFSKVYYEGLYNGIDLSVYSRDSSLEYDFVVQPGADAAAIAMVYTGVTPVLAGNGNLDIKTSVNEIIEQAPYAYQVINGVKKEVSVRFKMLGAGKIGFQLPQGYDKRYQLVIDPYLVFGGYTGYVGPPTYYYFAYCYTTTSDDSGNYYLGSTAAQVGYITTMGAYRQTYTQASNYPYPAFSYNAVVSKYSADGSTLSYATYYGGYTQSPGYLPDFERFPKPNLMTVNKKGELFVAGTTGTIDMPTTPGCYSSIYKGGYTDMYVIRFNAAGSALLGSTYIGGSDMDGWNDAGSAGYSKGGIITDAQGNIYISSGTFSYDFPTTPGVFQAINHGLLDACIFKMDPGCSKLLFSTYFGGSQSETGFDLKLNADHNLVLCGKTQSADLPITTGTFATKIFPNYVNGSGNTYWDDGYISVLKGDGTALLYSTFIGIPTKGTRCYKVDLDVNDNICVCGEIFTKDPTALHTLGTYYDSLGEIFIAKFSPDLSRLLVATRIGSGFGVPIASGHWKGFNDLSANSVGSTGFMAFGLDHCDNIYVAASVPALTSPTLLPVLLNDIPLAITPNALSNILGYTNLSSGFWIVSLSADLTSVRYATPLGSGDDLPVGNLYFDREGTFYGCMMTSALINKTPQAPTFPVTPNSYYIGGWGNYIFKLAAGYRIFPFACTLNNIDSLCGEPITMSLTGKQHNVGSYLWDFGDGTTGVDSLPVAHTYTMAGDYKVKLITTNSTDTFHCLSQYDTTSIVLHIHKPDTAYASHSESLCSDGNSILLKGTSGYLKFLWQDGTTDSLQTVTDAGTYWVRSDTFCAQHNDTFYVIKKHLDFNLGNDTTLCSASLFLNINMPGTLQYFWNDTAGSRQYIVQKTGLYRAEVRDGICSNTDSIYVKIIDLPQQLGNDTTVCTSDVLHVLLAANIDAGAHALWSTGSVENSIAAVDTGRYWVQVAEDGCIYGDTIVINGTLCECHFGMPSAFTPNGDGKNDVFRPVVEPACSIQDATFNIYDRWGALIYTTNDIRKGWDGNKSGVPMGVDTYMYTIQFTGGTHKQQYQQKGDVTLIR